MIPRNQPLTLKNVVSASVVICAAVGAFATGLAAGQCEQNRLPAFKTSEVAAMDPAVFGSSAGQASMKAAPTTWSSRSNVRWNARWSSTGRYLV